MFGRLFVYFSTTLLANWSCGRLLSLLKNESLNRLKRKPNQCLLQEKIQGLFLIVNEKPKIFLVFIFCLAKLFEKRFENTIQRKEFLRHCSNVFLLSYSKTQNNIFVKTKLKTNYRKTKNHKTSKLNYSKEFNMIFHSKNSFPKSTKKQLTPRWCQLFPERIDCGYLRQW